MVCHRVYKLLEYIKFLNPTDLITARVIIISFYLTIVIRVLDAKTLEDPEITNEQKRLADKARDIDDNKKLNDL